MQRFLWMVLRSAGPQEQKVEIQMARADQGDGDAHPRDD